MFYSTSKCSHTYPSPVWGPLLLISSVIFCGYNSMTTVFWERLVMHKTTIVRRNRCSIIFCCFSGFVEYLNSCCFLCYLLLYLYRNKPAFVSSNQSLEFQVYYSIIEKILIFHLDSSTIQENSLGNDVTRSTAEVNCEVKWITIVTAANVAVTPNDTTDAIVNAVMNSVSPVAAPRLPSIFFL